MPKVRPLPPSYQRVVNTMAEGKTLVASRLNSHAFFKGGSHAKVAANIPFALEQRGVVVRTKEDWRFCEFTLTELGRSLVKSLPVPEATTWWRSDNYEPKSVEFYGETAAKLITESGDKVDKSAYYRTREEAVESIHAYLTRVATERRASAECAEQRLAAFRKKEKIECHPTK